jgi:thiamine biosynthesis lipoprotein
VALRASGTAFGETAELEIRALDNTTGEAALGAAWDAMRAVEQELRQMEEQAAGQPFAVAPATSPLFTRARHFCLWSDGATSVLGGAVHRLWGVRTPAAALPTPDELEQAVASARCDRLEFDPKTSRARLAEGSALDFRGFARGWAIDRAVESLKEHGVSNVWVRIGDVARGVGGGPNGRGWPYQLPLFARQLESFGTVLLRGQSIARTDPTARPLAIAGESVLPYFDLRSGRPAAGVSGVVAVSELAGDAEPLAIAMTVLGANAGQIRLSGLKPKPSILWLLGSGDSGAPVLVSANWSAVKKLP